MKVSLFRPDQYAGLFFALSFRHLTLLAARCLSTTAFFVVLFAAAPFALPKAHAACSPKLGKVKINEVYLPNSGTSFIELKILDASLTPTSIGTWTLKMWEGNTSTTASTPVSAGTSNTGSCGTASLWIRFTSAQLSLLDNSDTFPFNFALLDENGKLVDLMRLGNNVTSIYSLAESCPVIESSLTSPGTSNTMYDAMRGSGSSIKDWYRNPDGTGPWGGTGTSNPGNTTCGTNDTTGGGTFGMAKVPSTEVVPTGSSFSYTLYAVNGGTAVSNGSNITITDTMPSGLTCTSCSSPTIGTCSCTSTTTLTWNFGTTSMAANTSHTATLNVTASTSGVKTNTAISNVGNSPFVQATAVGVTVFDPPVNYVLDQTSYAANGSVSGAIISGTLLLADSGSSAVTTNFGKICNGLDAVFKTGDGISVTDTTGSVLDIATTGGTFSFWVKPDAGTTANRALFSKGSGYFAYTDSSSRLVFGWKNGATLNTVTSTSSLSSGVWTHIALVFSPSTNKPQIYLNGELHATGTGTTVPVDDNTALLIGGATSSTVTAVPLTGVTGGFEGVLDEFKIFKAAITAANIWYVYLTEDAGKNYDGTTRTCSGLHHVRIGHDGSGGVCTREPVTFKACNDSSCSSLYALGLTLTPTATPSGGTWYAAATGGSSVSTITIPTEGSATYYLAYPNPVAVTLGATSFSATPSNSYLCDNTTSATAANSTTECVNTFSTASFTVLEDLAAKISGTGVAVAGRNHDFQVTINRVDNGTCGPVTNYAPGNLKVWLSRDTADPGGTAPSIGANSVPNSTATANIPFTFNATTGVASFDLSTTDVGKYTINFLDDSQASSATSISGSQSLTVRPFALYLHSAQKSSPTPTITNPKGASDFLTAGETFEATLSAVRWNTALDSNDDGIPDVSPSSAPTTWTTLAASGRTASFAANATLAVDSITEPATGGSGTLGGTTSIASTAWSSGSVVLATNSLSFNNAGSFTASATSTGYLGLSGSLPYASDVIGRFYPYQIGLKSGTGVVTPACSSFTYMGQPFAISYTLQALAKDGTTVLSNYGSSYLGTKATPSLVLEDSGYAGTDLAGRLSSAPSASWTAGEYAASSSAVVFSRPSSPAPNSGAITNWGGPFGTPSSATLKIGVKADAPTSATAIKSADMFSTTSPTARQLPTGSPTRMMFGILRLDNAYGSEIIGRLTIPVRKLYLSGFSATTPLFSSNTLDTSCSSVSVPLSEVTGSTVNLTYANYTQAFNTTTRNIDVSWGAAGRVAGSMDLKANLATSTWLRGNWTGASFDQDPVARIKLGSPKTPFIYQRELY